MAFRAKRAYSLFRHLAARRRICARVRRHYGAWRRMTFRAPGARHHVGVNVRGCIRNRRCYNIAAAVLSLAAAYALPRRGVRAVPAYSIPYATRRGVP